MMYIDGAQLPTRCRPHDPPPALDIHLPRDRSVGCFPSPTPLTIERLTSSPKGEKAGLAGTSEYFCHSFVAASCSSEGVAFEASKSEWRPKPT